MLINTNLDDGIAEKIDYLVKATQLTLADILKNSVNLYYELTRISPADKFKAFEEAGFIGCGEMEKYANLPMDLADASLVILAEHLGHGRILSSDVRDFNVYRWKDNKPFENLFLR